MATNSHANVPVTADAEEGKLDGLNSPETDSDKRKMCYEDDDKQQDKKKTKDKNKQNQEEVKAKESPSKNEGSVTEKEGREHLTNRKPPEEGGRVTITDEASGSLDQGREKIDEDQERRTNTASIPSNSSGPKHYYTQRQIDSFHVRVLAIEKTLENSENRGEQSKAGVKEHSHYQHYHHLASETARARSPSVPNTLTLGVPKGADDYREGALDDASPCSSRWALSPLLEVRRPHCTLNCENCKIILEERFKHKIIENVKNGQKPSFRPIVDDLYRDDPSSKDVVALMKKCWGEDPADRPDFSALKNHINKLNKRKYNDGNAVPWNGAVGNGMQQNLLQHYATPA